MAQSAIERVGVDLVLPVQEIAQLLTRLTREPVALQEGKTAMLPEEEEVQDPAESGTAAIADGPLPGPPPRSPAPTAAVQSGSRSEGELVRYRCHVGHAYTVDSMVGAQAALVEAALWTAVRALEEKAQLSRRLEERSRSAASTGSPSAMREAVQSAELGSSSIRHLLLNGTADPVPRESPEQAGEHAEWGAEVSGGATVIGTPRSKP